jgi:hypothetical protein
MRGNGRRATPRGRDAPAGGARGHGRSETHERARQIAVEDVDVPESDDDGVVDGLVDGVESPPMLGQSPRGWVVAAFSSSVAAGVVEVDFGAEPEEFVAAWATAPPASRAETAKVAMTCLERVTISVHLLSVGA